MPRSRASLLQLGERVDKARELLAVLPTAQVVRQLARDYGVSPRQARKYVTAVYAEYRAQSVEEAPHRREKTYQMIERLFAKAHVKGDLKAAVSAGAQLVKMASGFAQHDPDRKRRILEAVGPRPSDSAQAVLYAQRALLFGLEEVLADATLDPERRHRWIVEYSKDIGLLQDKAAIEDRLRKAEEAMGLEASGGEVTSGAPGPH